MQAPHTHDHVFDRGSAAAESGTRAVAWITAGMMAIEIAAGWWFNSMALLADGWHMSSHALAIGLSTFAYVAARRYAGDPRFAFGTWKIEILGGFASAILLVGVAGLMVAGSIERLITPQPIEYREAMAVAVLGLVVNMVCALILGRVHGHAHGPGAHEHGHAHPGHDHAHHHHDLNLKSAYVHVVADAATSVLAIVALAGGWIYGWGWLDPATGLLGAVLVAAWARGLVMQTGAVLLDREMDHPLVAGIRTAVEGGGARVADLHVWRVGRSAWACTMTVLTEDPALTPDRVRQQLAVHGALVHTTVEVQPLHPESVRRV